MNKLELLDTLLQENNGYLKTSDAASAGVSRAYLGTYVRDKGLERVAHGLYVSKDTWDDGMYIIQMRYPTAIFSHETALYLLSLAEREPIKYSLTLRAGSNTSGLTKQGVKVYKVKTDLFDEGLTEALTPAGHTVRTYNPERTICDLLRSRRNIEIQDLQGAVKAYLRSVDKNIPLLLRYAKSFSVEKIVRQYLEVLL
jgi:predicted transcriptional regulator of viral defense system